MALIRCYECSKEISDKAAICPQCDAPLKRKLLSTLNTFSVGYKVALTIGGVLFWVVVVRTWWTGAPNSSMGLLDIIPLVYIWWLWRSKVPTEDEQTEYPDESFEGFRAELAAGGVGLTREEAIAVRYAWDNNEKHGSDATAEALNDLLDKANENCPDLDIINGNWPDDIPEARRRGNRLWEEAAKKDPALLSISGGPVVESPEVDSGRQMLNIAAGLVAASCLAWLFFDYVIYWEVPPYPLVLAQQVSGLVLLVLAARIEEKRRLLVGLFFLVNVVGDVVLYPVYEIPWSTFFEPAGMLGHFHLVNAGFFDFLSAAMSLVSILGSMIAVAAILNPRRASPLEEGN